MRRGAALLGLTVAFLLLAAPAGAIDGVKYSPVTKHWYKRYGDILTWQVARSRAAAAGGYLATITSAAENAWVVGNFSVGGTWLGATDEVSEGTWKWVTSEVWSYTNWMPGEPNNAGGKEHYLEYQTGANTWNDAPPNDSNGYLVEWDKDPNGGPPPPPPPPPPPVPLPDLVATVLSLTPPSPAPGETIRLSFTARNAGEPSGAVTARLGLAGYDGPVLAERMLLALGSGQSTSSEIEGRVPEDIPSGEYHVTVLLDASGGRDANPSDNLGTYARAFRIEQEPIPLIPGLKIKEPLGPLGRQVFTLDAFPALSAKLKVKLKGGFGVKTLEREDGTPLAGATDKGKLKASIANEDGLLLVVVESEMDRPTTFQVSLKAKSIRETGEFAIGTEPVALEIPGFPGMTARLTLKGLDGFVPALDTGDPGESASVKVSGTKLKAKGLTLEGEGPWIVLVSGESGATGRCTYSVKVR